MMPVSEIKMEKTFVDSSGLIIIVQSGENGWSILYADGSSEYKDEVDTTDNNFEKAFKVLEGRLSNLKEISNQRMSER